MSSNSNNREMTTAPASQPIPINTTRVGRGRSFSVSSASSGSTSSPEIQTPVSSASNSVRIGPHSPGTSPIFNYFFNQQTPTKTASQASYPFKKMGPPPVFEEKETTFAAHHHARRASASFAGRYVGQPQASTSPEANYDGGAGLLRRLSIGNPFAGRPRSPPDAPPNSAVSPASPSQMPDFDRRARSKNRRQTISSDLGNRRRAPSPMGERILKGHFDGFN
ncbi:hypothetical protein CYLTODRAFT_178039 [Cylindrobasidium torrendii FP15055 ss-10]|uniref:Uncharacterized protein n=1 Tax=Cylindrobasidium torrendii FP15055 ss-10 TaxID=1314674 RepID=A0A0D7AVI9_9AGAR|nr:hypothetical protein CYLTODRAFT_178039 [Cylindrobasidium torrendii FP15055 ss-10]